MTGQRVWVRTLDGDEIAVDQIVRYKAVTGTATGWAVIEAFTSFGRVVRLGPFASERQALDFGRRHFGPVVDPADLYVGEQAPPAAADPAKYDPPSAADLVQALEDSIARGREAQREAGLRLDAPETA